MKKITLLSIAIFLISLLAVSCQKETPYQDGDRTVVPFSLNAVVTKASFNESTFAYGFKSGDKLAISSTERPDIEGELSKNGEGKWVGSVSYLTAQGEPASSTAIIVTLVHADNSETSTYANGIAYELGSSSSLLQAAVEQYSLFTADITFGSTEAHLQQQACFLDATVTFAFENGNFRLAGETSVDVKVNNTLTITGKAVLAQVGDSKHYSTEFVIAMPGGTTLTDESVIQICDRNVPLVSVDKTLEVNNKYTVSRSVNFEPQLGDPFWSDGTYGRISHPQGVVVTGIIVFVNNYADDNETPLAVEARALTEKASGFGHALVMSLKNAGTPGVGIQWATSNAQHGTYTPAYITKPSEILETTNVSGYSNTNVLRGSNNNIAAKTATEYRSGEGDTITGTSGWFLPSIGQWVYSISRRGFGGADPADQWQSNDGKNFLTKGKLGDLVRVINNGTVNENKLVSSLNNRMQVLQDDFGCAYDVFGMTVGNSYGDNYWSSTENEAGKAIRMNFGSVEQSGDNYYSTIKVKGESKTSTYAFAQGFIMKVRPFLAF